MLLFIALGQWLAGVPPLQTAECSGTGLKAFAMRCGLIGHPDFSNEAGLPDLPDGVMGAGDAEPWGYVLELATTIELQAPAWRRIPSRFIPTYVGWAPP